MDTAALTELRARMVEAQTMSEKYYSLAAAEPRRDAFYAALALTYRRVATEMGLMLAKASRVAAGSIERAA